MKKIKQYFLEDTAALEDDFQNTRKKSIPVKPSFDACTKHMTAKLAQLNADFTKPFATSRIIEKSISADGDRFFTYSIGKKFNNMIACLCPDGD